MKLNPVESGIFISIPHVQPGKLWRLKSLAVMLLIFPILTLACTRSNVNVTYFPVEKEIPVDIMDGQLPGRLVLDDTGYLRVDDLTGNPVLIIWPYGYSYKTEDKDIWIINDKGQAVACVGDWVNLRGGQIPAWAVEIRIGQALPEDARGPYWIAGDVRID